MTKPTLAQATCPRCKRDIAASETTWPGAPGEAVCQDCWEAWSDHLFWQTVPYLDIPENRDDA